MENKHNKQDKRKNPETPPTESSWSPVPGNNPIHSKMDWMDEVHFKFVRGVEIPDSTEPLLHPHKA